QEWWAGAADRRHESKWVLRPFDLHNHAGATSRPRDNLESLFVSGRNDLGRHSFRQRIVVLPELSRPCFSPAPERVRPRLSYGFPRGCRIRKSSASLLAGGLSSDVRSPAGAFTIW